MGLNTKCPIHGSAHPDFLCPKLPDPLLEQCPHIKRVFGGDESIDLCEINDKICLLETDMLCETWDEIRAEIESNQ